MRKMELAQNRNAVLLAVAYSRCRPFSDAVDSQYRGILKRGGVKGAGGMREVVLGEYKTRDTPSQFRKLLPQHVLHEELFLDPNRDGGKKAHQSPRGEGVIRFKQALKLYIRLIIKGNDLQVRESQAGFLKNVSARIG